MTSNVGDLTMDTPSDCEFAITRTFAALRELVWQAWTDPRHVPQWMLGPEGWTMPVCEIDLRVGGAWRFVWRHADGDEMAMTGVYREIVSPERLVATESWGGDWPESVNTVTLVEDGGNTRMTLTILYVSQEARDNALRTGMKEGIAVTYDRLALYLDTLR